MAEGETEKLIISVTPDAINPRGEVRRISTRKLNIQTSPSLASSGDKLPPHYLRASSASCHDYCKYGHKHVFGAKKRQPSFRNFSDNNDIQHEVENKVEVSVLRVRRKRAELKVKTTHPKDELPDKIKKTQNDIQLSNTIRNPEKESYEESESINLLTPSLHESILSLGHRPFGRGEDLLDVLKNIDAESYEQSESIKWTSPSPFYESSASLERKSSIESEGLSEQPISIRTVITSPEDGLEFPMESEAMELETPSPVEKDIVSRVPTPLTWSEGSSYGSASTELEISPVESSEEPIEVEVVTPSPVVESVASADDTTRLKPKTSLAARKSFPSTKLTLPSRAEKSSELDQSVKLKVSSSNHKNFIDNTNQTGLKNLKMGDGKKRETMQLKTAPQPKKVVSNRAEAIKEKNVEVTGKLSVIKKRNPIEETRMSVKLKMTEVKIPSSVEKPGVFKRKVVSPFKRMDVAARSSISLKMKTPMVKSTSSLVSSTRLPAQTNQGNRMIGNRDLPKLQKENVLKPSRVSLPPKTTGNGVSSMNSRKCRSSTPITPAESRAKVDKFERTDATLKEPKLVKAVPKAIKKPKKKKSCSSSGSLSSTSSTSTLKEATELLFNDEETKREKPVHSQKDVDKQRSGRIASSQTDDKHRSPHKLNFRRAEILSPTSESNGPRKLRFRQARAANDNHSGKEVGRRSFRQRRGSGGSVAELSTSNREAPPIVLRHQGVQEKKESQGLFDHVIEEAAKKLNFCRGKTVSPKSESNGPRKSRFRHARAANDNHNGKEVGRRSFRMRRGSGGSVAELITHIPEAPPVVLRHQGVQEKKEAQCLFNHVIEETANKLVETRKSKVKALVGAFETVISLQESRMTPTV